MALLPAVEAPERGSVIPAWSAIWSANFNINIKDIIATLVHVWKQSKKSFMTLNHHLTDDGIITPINTEAVHRLKQNLKNLAAFQNVITRYLWYSMFRRTCKEIEKKVTEYKTQLTARHEENTNAYHYYTTCGMYIHGLITAWPKYMPNIRWGSDVNEQPSKALWIHPGSPIRSDPIPYIITGQPSEEIPQGQGSPGMNGGATTRFVRSVPNNGKKVDETSSAETSTLIPTVSTHMRPTSQEPKEDRVTTTLEHFETSTQKVMVDPDSDQNFQTDTTPGISCPTRVPPTTKDPNA